MKKKVYLETSIVSYLTAKPSRDLILAAHQEITREWWEVLRQDFDLFVSQLVVDEASKGDAAAAKKRLLAIEGLQLLPVTDTATRFANDLVARGILAENAKFDAFHLALATVHRIDYLLTWNCKHLANAKIIAKAARFALSQRYELPVICTPEELTHDEETQGV